MPFLLPAKKIPVSAPRRRISWTASRAASAADSEASIVCKSFFRSASTWRSRAIASLRYHRAMNGAVNAAWTRLSSAALYTRGKLTLREDAWRLPDGQEIVYPVLAVGVTVGVLPFVEPARVLLVRQYRHLLGEVSWELPGGGAQPGEDPLAAAQRELREEGGYRAERLEF